MSNMNLNCEFLEKYPLYSLINVLDYYFLNCQIKLDFSSNSEKLGRVIDNSMIS